jgi:hypothetical protein
MAFALAGLAVAAFVAVLLFASRIDRATSRRVLRGASRDQEDARLRGRREMLEQSAEIAFSPLISLPVDSACRVDDSTVKGEKSAAARALSGLRALTAPSFLLSR